MVGSLGDALPTKESHHIEFKKSLSSLREGAQTIVAFANAHGGNLFFGVAPDGQVGGVDVGANTLERLAADLDRYIYPYVPAAIDEVTAPNGKAVVEVSVVADTPPVVGVYLYSSQPLDVNARVPVTHLHAYRRVGRTNRKVPDFMWLRPQLRSDPLMLIDYGGMTRGDVIPKEIGGKAWLADGSGLAHALRFRIEPDLTTPRDSERSLPSSNGRRSAEFNFDLGRRTDPLDGAWVIVGYQDDWGCVWESRRYIEFKNGEAQPTTKLVRRIVELPPKRGAA